MDMHLPVLDQLVHWARSIANNDANETIEQLAKDKSEAKAEICAVMERLADKHGISLPADNQVMMLSYVDEAIDEVTLDLEDELQNESDEASDIC